MGLKPKAVVVIDIASGRVVKRYATATEAAEARRCSASTATAPSVSPARMAAMAAACSSSMRARLAASAKYRLR